MTSRLTALCVGRHRFLSEHLGRFFRRAGADTRCVVGLDDARRATRESPPDLVIDYDLLITTPLRGSDDDALFRSVPVVAVSLTRRPEEMQPLDVNAVGGVLSLPMLDRSAALRHLEMVRQAARHLPSHDWPRPAAGVHPA